MPTSTPRAASTAAPALRPVPLLRVDPSLADELTPAEAAAAERSVRVGVVTLPAGAWAPPAERPPRALGLLVADGLALRTAELSGRRQSQLLGPGDVVDPWSPTTTDLCPRRASWRLLETVTLAVLDDEAVVAAAAHPGLAVALTARLVGRAERLGTLAALTQLPRTDLRLLAFMWHLAQRWGRVGSAGILLHLPVTHEILGHLAGSRRPSVTLALQQLDACGLLRRRPERGLWIVHHDAGPVVTGDGEALDAYYATAR